MGTSIKTQYPTNKEAMTVAVEAAAAIVVGAGELVIWVGANIDATHRRADIQRALDTCFDALRENIPSFPTAQQVTSCVFTPGAATSSSVVSEGAGPALPTEDDVGMFYDQAYVEAPGRPSASQLFRGKAVELVEWWMEQRKAA